MTKSEMSAALKPLAEQNAKEAELSRAARLAHEIARPVLSSEGVVEYLDWLASGLHTLEPEHVAHHLAAAELVVRVHMGNAQNKATQHTLVEDGIIAPAPTAS